MQNIEIVELTGIALET